MSTDGSFETLYVLRIPLFANRYPIINLCHLSVNDEHSTVTL